MRRIIRKSFLRFSLSLKHVSFPLPENIFVIGEFKETIRNVKQNDKENFNDTIAFLIILVKI